MNKVQLGAKIELARRDFFEYCHLKAPRFYKYERKYLVKIADEMQKFLESKEDVLIINVPPRHGKSRTAGNFVEWVLGNNPDKKVMVGSYNETLSTRFSKNVRNTIQEVKANTEKVVYSDIFPGTKIKYGDAAMNLWSLEGRDFSYLATSPSGTATGFGADILIIDDLIKNAVEANNEVVLESHWDWFTDTMLSRLESGGKIIIIMTRWHTKDLAGRALSELPELGYKVRHVNMKALQDDGTMLCDDILSMDEYERKIKTMGEEIASANYQQEPIDLKGTLYKNLKTYEELPNYFEKIINYTDTADEGNDYLCSIVAGVYKGEAYILDVYYTKEGMEVTEKETARFLVRNKVNRSKIESNNGGKGFARNVKRIIWEEYKTKSVVIKWFHQSQNKMARILTNSSYVMEHVYFPYNWRHRWPEFYKAITEFQKEGKNKHDDAPDALTGIAEMVNENGFIFIN